MKSFAYVIPATVDEAARASAEKGSLLKAGGIDVLDLLKNDLVRPERLVNLLAVAGLRDITETGTEIRIGALATLAAVAAHPRLPRVLVEAAEDAATPQIRNVATVGGNLCQRPRCWYFRNAAFRCLKKGGHECFAPAGENRYHAVFDVVPCPIVHPSNLAPALMALDATIVTNRRSIPVDDFFVSPKMAIDRETQLAEGEIITEVVIPGRPWKTAYREAGEKASFDWALVAAAVALETNGRIVTTARVVLGAVAPVPMRARQAEAALAGKTLTPAVAVKAAEAAFASAVPLRDNGYKVALGKVILRRAILAAAGHASEGG